MKKILLVAVMLLTACQIWAGGSNSCYAIKTPKNGSTSSFEPRQTDRPTKLQTRSTAAAITIDEADFLALIQPGKYQWKRYYDPLTTSITMNLDGVDNGSGVLKWTLPNSLTTALYGSKLMRYITPASVTPAGAQVAGATHVGWRNILDDSGNTVVEYEHYQLNTGGDLNEMGTTLVNGSHIANHGDPTGQIYADVPFEMGDVFTVNTEEYDDDDDYPYTATTSTVSVDNWGLLETPEGTVYNCLRANVAKTTVTHTSASVSSTTVSNEVMFITKEGYVFLATKPTAGYGTAVNLSYLRAWYSGFSSALTVELIDFQGITSEKGTDLTWSTANETNNAYFTVERSEDGKNFEKIGSVSGAGTTTQPKHYAFNDPNPLSKTTYFRLRQFDFDGSSVVSNVIALSPLGTQKTLKVYPNPSSDNSISIEGAENTEGGILVTNSVGQTVFQAPKFSNRAFRLDVSRWASGIYFIKSGQNMVKFVKN